MNKAASEIVPEAADDVAWKLQILKMGDVASTKPPFARIAHGIFLAVFESPQASQLLHAAQVASTLESRRGAK